MADIVISYTHSESGHRIPQYTITPAIEHYFNFLCSTANLDRTLVDDGEARKAVHIVAEGMIPEDRGASGTIDPKRSSDRALEEELSISFGKNAIGEVTRSAATGFFFDQLRYQPCFAYIAHLDVDRDQLQAGLGSAQDSWEVEKLFFIRFDPENAEVIALLRHEHPYLKLASNHAHAVLWFACLYEFGYFRMRDYLNMPLGRIDKGAYTS